MPLNNDKDIPDYNSGKWKSDLAKVFSANSAKTWFKKEIRDILSCPITITALWMWILAFSNQAYRWYIHKQDWQNLNINEEVAQIIDKKPKNLSQATKKVIYIEINKALEQLSIDKAESDKISRWLLIEIEKSWLLDQTLPKPKPWWISALFALIYIYLYTKTIRKIRLDHHPVSTFSFAWFSILNGWFALSNWILDPWSLGYLSACIMWAVTVAVNEIEIRKLKGKKDELDVQKILLSFVVWEKNPVVIYKWDCSNKETEFPNEKPLFWNPAMEQISWYVFDDVKGMTQYEIMRLLYWYDERIFRDVMKHLAWVNNTWFWYKNKVFPLKTKDWNIVDVAWHTEKVPWGWRISFGSIDQTEINKSLRKDPTFDCSNLRALKEDFWWLISQLWDPDETAEKSSILSVLYSDFDWFRKINDNFGMLFWDIILSEYISYIKWELRRRDDDIYRNAWDEFVLICNCVNRNNIVHRVEMMKEHFSRITLIVEFSDWEFKVKQLKHWSNWAAKAYLNANVFVNEFSLKKYKAWDKWDYKIILPPMSSSWWITDFKFDKNTLSEIDVDSIVDKLIWQAIKAKYESKKKWNNHVTVFDITLAQDRS
ncbi:MAG: diguanylate cyclase/phosphodiesterase [uncultured bacterium (gcode 4)]|uniref:Diguanylate cyclase/phosphodiesterase n=1 Tax=uncultured bacterium (gcode 4) TaxID=1234023 RepID=K2GG33_9BACT|nr:MAG: diguanylate cyclase/phosphodiesterase [uncultured bacterium (gcode 4)]